MLRLFAEMGNPATEERLRQLDAPRHAQATVAAERPLPFLGNEHVVVRRVVNDAGHDLPLALERDRNGELRNRMQKIGRRVERIDMPGVTLVGAFDAAALLHDKAVAWTRLGEFRVEALLGPLIGKTDKIARPLHRHLQFADLAEIALQAPAGLDRGAGHHGHEGRADHGGSSGGSRGRKDVYGRRGAEATSRGRDRAFAIA